MQSNGVHQQPDPARNAAAPVAPGTRAPLAINTVWAATTGRSRLEAQVAAAMHGIPGALPNGDLPAGLHQAAMGEVATRYAVTPRRVNLTGQLERALEVMSKAGVEQAIVGGSYVGTKPRPDDVDVAIVPRGDGRRIRIGALQRQIEKVAPEVHVYAGEQVVANASEVKGVRLGETFAELFQHDREGAKRGALLLRPTPPAVSAASGGFVHDLIAGVARLLRH